MPAPCVCGYANSAHLARHKQSCVDMIIFNKDQEIDRLKMRVEDFEKGEAFSQLKRENDDLKNKLLVAMEKNQRPRITNNNNTINLNFYAFGEEPRLTEERVRGMIQSAVDLGQIVPRLLKEKHFKNDRTANIRIDVGNDKIETVRRDEKTGRLKWKKERKAPRKFCQDLAMSTMHELNEVCDQDPNRGSSRVWSSYYGNRFIDDGTEHKEKAGKDVCNLLKAHATKEDEDDMLDQ